jgi:hypothetical protein
MKANEFVKAIDTQHFYFSRTNLATNCIEEEFDTIPNSVEILKSGSVSIRIGGSIYCYDETDLFTYDFGVYLAVVKTGAGHLFCDRFKEIKEKI